MFFPRLSEVINGRLPRGASIKSLNTHTKHATFLTPSQDDWGWANVGWHREAGFNETVTPNLDALVASGVQLTQQFTHKYCSPTRSSLQSGRLPIHVNVLNADMSSYNAADPISGFAGVPRNMTGISAVMKKGGCT